jgi:hypothetical protein
MHSGNSGRPDAAKQADKRLRTDFDKRNSKTAIQRKLESARLLGWQLIQVRR